jgi:hypothetical protein
MMRRYNRLLVLFFVVSDALISGSSFALAYMLRFHWLTGIIPVTKGSPPFQYYGKLLPFVMAILPLAFHVQGVYHLRRGRSRVDDFFAVFVGSILAVVFGVGGTLYYNTYYVPDALKDLGVYEVSQLVWAFYLVTNIVLAYASREFVPRPWNVMEGWHQAEACPDCRVGDLGSWWRTRSSSIGNSDSK